MYAESSLHQRSTNDAFVALGGQLPDADLDSFSAA
jgi:hypothetical protein